MSIREDVLAIIGWFVALSVLYWIGVLLLCDGRSGFPLDDSFIHLQFARNLFNDGLMAFNPGVPSSGSTAPLYPMLLAGMYWFVRDWYLASYLLGGLCSLGSALAVYGILRSWTGDSGIARWGGVLTVFLNPTVVQAYSGMESAAYSLVFLLGLWCYTNPKRRTIAAILFAACVWLRPEFLVMLPLVCVERAIAAIRSDGKRLRTFLADIAPHLIVWGLIVSAYVAYNWHQDEHLLPSTFKAKALAPGLFRPLWLDNFPAAFQRGHVWHVLLSITVWPFLILVVAGLGLGFNCAPLALGLKRAFLALWRDTGPVASGRRLAIIVLIGYPWLRGFVDTWGVLWFQQQRYYAHLSPLLVLIVLGALPLTGVVLDRQRWSWRDKPFAFQRKRTLAWAGCCTICLGVLSVMSVWNINTMQVRAGEWVRANTTEDQLIATNDIGAIAFIGNREILDTVGLVEPPIVEHFMRGGELADYLQERDPAYVIIFPNWYDKLSARRDILQPVEEFSVDLNVVCGGPTLVVYRPAWHDHQESAGDAEMKERPGL